MPNIIERILTVMLLGLLPPRPLELRSDFAVASDSERHQHRVKYAIRHLRWSWVVSGVATAMILKTVWQAGWLAWLGLGSGIANTSEIDKLQVAINTARAEQYAFKDEYRRTVIRDTIRSIDTELFQLKLAVATAERNGRIPDRLHLERISTLNTQREELVRQRDATLTPPPQIGPTTR